MQIALSHKAMISKMLIQRDLIRVDSQKLAHYLDLYANKNSISLSQDQIKALNVLFKIGYDKGFYPDILEVEDCLIPIEYKNLLKS